MKILIADDDPLLRRLVRSQLVALGHEVVEAADGREAWRAMQAEPAPLVLADWVMPHMDGAELIRRIRARWNMEPRADGPGYIYIILLTARDAKDFVVTGLQAGADDYVTKPFHAAELAARIGIGERIVQLERRLSQSLADLEEMAIRDSLTGLYNRRAFDARLADEIRRAERYGRPLSVIMADIDCLKLYNDTHGHSQGDYLLREVAGLLTEQVRSTDFVARYGGDEFAILLPETDRASAEAVAEKIYAQVTAYQFQLGETQPGGVVTLSVGVSSYPEELLDGEGLLASADEALYRLKKSRSAAVAASMAEA
jgi:two-component system chemotaxis response regulator CheY